METIKIYLDNLFSNLPQSPQLLQAKDALREMMEDKLEQLIADGHTQNEALGQVICEFGNIDELLSEIGVEKQSPQQLQRQDSDLRVVEDSQVQQFVNSCILRGKLVGIGVALCILSPVVMILGAGLAEAGKIPVSEDFAGMIGLLVLLPMIAIGVALFIFSSMKEQKFDYLKRPFVLENSSKYRIERLKDEFAPKKFAAIAAGVGLCILSPVGVIVAGVLESDVIAVMCVALLLVLVAISVYLFIYVGTIDEGYNQLLKIGEHIPMPIQKSKIAQATGAVVWPVATIAFFVWGLVYDGFWICWIVWPIGGLIVGMVSSLCTLFEAKS